MPINRERKQQLKSKFARKKRTINFALDPVYYTTTKLPNFAVTGTLDYDINELRQYFKEMKNSI
uniref:Uncharacterized protein n=1 Tax=Romanomermis culicivorax TaxID=13658 RepID=A0A915ITC8_ROMCU